MSSASLWSGTRLRMKLRKRGRSRSIASEIRSSCSTIAHCFLSAWSIYWCRRMSAANIVWRYCRKLERVSKKMASADLAVAPPAAQAASMAAPDGTAKAVPYPKPLRPALGFGRGFRPVGYFGKSITIFQIHEAVKELSRKQAARQNKYAAEYDPQDACADDPFAPLVGMGEAKDNRRKYEPYPQRSKNRADQL